MHEQQPTSPQNPMRQSASVLLWLAHAHAWCFWPFLHNRLGIRAPGSFGIGALALMMVAVGLSRDPALLIFGGLWLFALACRRAEAQKLFAQGIYEHSHYNGWPVVATKFPGIKTERQAKNCEAMICLVVGLSLVAFSECLGGFIAFGFISILLTRGIEDQLTRQRDIAWQDAEIEMAQYARRRGQRHLYY